MLTFDIMQLFKYLFVFFLVSTCTFGQYELFGMEKCKQFVERKKQAFYTKQLFKATTGGDLAKARHFLLKFPNLVHARDEAGNTPLHVIKVGPADTELITLFLEGGALVNARNAFDETPLHCFGKQKWSEECVALLLKHRADVHARNLDENTALHVAARINLASTRLLLRAGANPNATNELGQTPLHLAFLELPDLPEYDWFLIIKEDGDVTSGLHKRTRESIQSYRTRRCVEVLLEGGARIDILDKQGELPACAQHPYIKKNMYAKLLQAIMEKDNRTVVRLLRQGVDPNINLKQLELLSDIHGTEYLLNVAMFEYNANAVRCLLDFGADPCKRPSYWPHDYSVEVLEFVERPMPLSIARKAFDFGCPEMAQIMLTHIPLHRYRRLWNTIVVPLAQCKKYKLLPADLRRMIAISYCLKSAILREQQAAAVVICQDSCVSLEGDNLMFMPQLCEQYVSSWNEQMQKVLHAKNITYRSLLSAIQE